MFFAASMPHGDVFDASVEKRQHRPFPMYFVAAAWHDSQRNWWMHMKRDILKKRHLDGSLKVAGHTAIKEEIPDDIKEKRPDPPQLGKLVVTGPENDKQLCIPEEVTKKWCNHPVFGVRFQSFMDAFCEEHHLRISLRSDRPCVVIS